MAKHPREIENPMLKLVDNKWYKQPNPPAENMCGCGCGKSIDLGLDSYIIVDERKFWDAEHVTDYYISQAGGRRVWGGFDDAS